MCTSIVVVMFVSLSSDDFAHNAHQKDMFEEQFYRYYWFLIDMITNTAHSLSSKHVYEIEGEIFLFENMKHRDEKRQTANSDMPFI